MDDSAADGALLGEGAHLGHQVVMDFVLDLQCAGDAGFGHILGMGAQVGDLLGGHDAQLVLRFRQGDPHAAPQQAFGALAPYGAHGGAAVAGGEGGLVSGDWGLGIWNGHRSPHVRNSASLIKGQTPAL